MRWPLRAAPTSAAAAVSALAAVAAHDLLQRQHALLRNFPVIGHARNLLESIGPELRQYIVASNNEERPFTRDQRRWVYASAKKQNNYLGFGTDNDIEYTAGYPIIKHRTFGRAIPPSAPAAGEESPVPAAKVLGGPRGRRHAFRPASVVNISAMSFGSLSGNAVEALNRGAAWPAVCTTPARAASRRTTARAESWSSRSVRRTSAAVTRGGGSASIGFVTWSRAGRCAPWGSSCPRGRSRDSAACCRGPRSPRRSPRPAASPRVGTASARPGTRSSPTRQPA